MSQHRMSKSTAIGLGAILGLALFGVFAATQLSAHGGNTTQIHACLNNSSGEVKIVGADRDCKKNESAVQWPGGDGIRSVARTVGFAGPTAQGDFSDAIGPIPNRSLGFNKTQDDTGIRVVYTDNFRCYGNAVACGWEIFFDGQSCPNPGRLAYSYYTAGPGAMNIHRSNTLVGTCFGLSAGAHTIEVHRVLVPAHTPGDFDTGWRSHWSIEAEEVR